MAGGAADGLYTYDIPLADGGPRVPDADDLGGVNIKNGDPPPHKGDDRDADMDNVQTATLAGCARMDPTARVSVEYTAGNYVVVRVDSMGTLVDADDFSFSPIGTGHLTMSWTDGTLPPQGGKPRVYVPDADGYGRATSGVNQVEVFLKLHAADAAANLNFIIEIFG